MCKSFLRGCSQQYKECKYNQSDCFTVQQGNATDYHELLAFEAAAFMRRSCWNCARLVMIIALASWYSTLI